MKGWLDNFGKADNANNSNVSVSKDFVGLGYNTKGRNYSPAWGGQFQDGGIIPIAQSGVTAYMKKKIQEEKDKDIAAQYNLPEVVVEAPYLTEYNDPNKPTGFPQYEAKSNDIAEFYKSWVSSPEYEKRMKNTGYYTADDDFWHNDARKNIRLSYDEHLLPIRSGNMLSLEGTQEPGFIKIEPALYKGQPASVYSPSGISIHPEHAKNPETLQTVTAHEIAHAIDSDSPFERQLIYDTMLEGDAFYKQPQFYSGVNPLTGNRISNEKDRERKGMALYVKNDPQEFKSDLNALRFLMFDKGIYDIRKGKEFTKEDLERAKEKLKGNQSLERSIDAAGESGFIKLMNVIAKRDEEVAPIAMNGTSMPGSVGFTYARTAGSAPSKGKYAKKTMASAQEGKNDIEKISIDDPRYPEMYKNRQVGLSYDGTISLPDLDEVTITAPRSYTMDSLRDFTTAALYGAPANAMKLSMTPQAAMTEGIEALRGKPYDFSNVNPNIGYFTSNQRDLSKTMGYEKPEGFLQNAANIGLSAIDPLLVTSLASALRKPLQKGAQQFGKHLTDNTWRLNPKAYQYNLPENTMWRGIGKEGMEDAISSGVFRAKQNVEPSYYRNSSLNLNKSFGANTYFTPKFGTAASYSPDYLAEVPRSIANWRNRYKKSDWSQIADRQIPISEGRILQKDWLKGYKEVPQKQNGDNIPSAQNGQEMRFYQNGLDWKPKSMQDGGDQIYEGLELPEFVVEGKDERMKEAMSQGIGKFYAHVGELMGAPQKEMMQFITGKEQTPSEAWGFQNTGDWLDSYSSFGKNLSNLAMNNILDPVNAIPGVGLVDDLTKGAVRAASQNAVSKTLQRGLSPWGYEIENIARIPQNLIRNIDGKSKKFSSAVQRNINEGRGQFILQGLKNREDAWSTYLGLDRDFNTMKLVGSDDATGLSKYEYTNPIVFEKASPRPNPKAGAQNQRMAKALYDVSEGRLYNKKILDNDYEDVAKLDLNVPGSSTVGNDKLFGTMGGFQKYVSPDGKNLMYRDIWDLQPFSRLTSDQLPKDMLGNAIRNFEVSSIVPGAKPFVAQGKLGDIKTKFFQAELYKNIAKRYGELKRQGFSTTDIKRLLSEEKSFLNPVPLEESIKYVDTNPYTRFGNSKPDLSGFDFTPSRPEKFLQKIQDAANQPVSKFEIGGVIKDDRGQWAYPGEVTEINSNYITMEGVPYDVVGVSNTGDTKLMKPGKNYKFKGKKVTEYPVAKLGINQLDAQPMKKLNQLLNFTNNPDKDNWLDKYN
jgi:hypothetical protein